MALEVVLQVPFWLEAAGALTGGLAGGLMAARARYDVFGTSCIAIVAGLGGGILRDVLLQDYGIYAFQHPVLLVACALAGVFACYFHKLVDAIDWLVVLLDNLSVGLWSVVSVGKALSAGLDIVPAALLGTIVAVGGGVMRDVLMARPPATFQAGSLYGIAALIGSVVFALMKQNDVLGNYAALACVVLVVGIRFAADKFGWRTKPAEDHTDQVVETGKKAAHVAAKPMKAMFRPIKRATIYRAKLENEEFQARSRDPEQGDPRVR